MAQLRKCFTVFVLMTVMAAAVSPGMSACDVTVHPDDGPCRTQAAATEVGQTEGAADPAEDCCTTGCRDCTLPCCARTAVVLAGLPPLGNPGPVAGATAETEIARPLVAADSQYRPPQV